MLIFHKHNQKSQQNHAHLWYWPVCNTVDSLFYKFDDKPAQICKNQLYCSTEAAPITASIFISWEIFPYKPMRKSSHSFNVNEFKIIINMIRGEMKTLTDHQSLSEPNRTGFLHKGHSHTDNPFDTISVPTVNQASAHKQSLKALPYCSTHVTPFSASVIGQSVRII